MKKCSMSTGKDRLFSKSPIQVDGMMLFKY